MFNGSRRRIALLLESDGPGGAETVVLQLGQELAHRGHEVLFVGPAEGNGWLGERFATAGLRTTTFRKRHPLDPRWVSDLVATLHGHRIDVVHAHEFAMSVYGTAAARRLGLTTVSTFHGAEWMTHALRRRMALRWAVPRATAACAVSRATKQQLDADLGLAPDQVHVVRNGVPIRPGNGSRVREELRISDDELMILAIGNLEQRKGHMFLLRAMQRLSENGLTVPWRVVIAGGRGGPMHKPLLDFSRDCGFADRVQILTYRNDVPDLQAATDVFAMPSLWEGLPLAVLEAMLAGNPIVASDTSGIPEAISNGREGLLTSPGDVDQLADAMGRLLTDGELRNRLGAAAQERSMREFTIAVMTDRYEALYGIPSSSS